MKYNGTDIYCYADAPGVLINKYNLKDLEKLEQKIIRDQMMVIDSIKIQSPFSLNSLCHIHRELFKCAFNWAGIVRTTDISKGGTRFCNVNYIEDNSNKIFEELSILTKKMNVRRNYQLNNNLSWSEDFDFLKQNIDILGGIIADLNMLHPFREGNGRTLRLFIELYLDYFGLVMYLDASSARWMKASIEDDANEFVSILLDSIQS